MGTEITWVAIAASLAMALAGACIFAFAVLRDHFKNLEDTKYQVFWSDHDGDTRRREPDDYERGSTKE
jgi:hypothetical protein